MRSRRLVAILGSVALGVGAAFVNPLAGTAATVTTVNGFVNYQLGDLPAEYCPDPNSPCQNGAAEPAIRADGFGNFYGSSENGITSGTEAWKSIDGGLHYTHLPSPNKLSSPTGSPGVDLSPAGGDTDLATAPVKNQFGLYNVYVASLELTSVDVSTSRDGGHTWSQNPVSSVVKGDDREWAAADGASKICISYHDLGSVGLHVDCSYDAGATFLQDADAIDAAHSYTRAMFVIGNQAIDQRSNTGDPSRHGDIVYQPFASGTLADATNPNPTGHHVVYVGVSTDGGQHFTDYTVYTNPDIRADYGHQFVNVSVDRAGNVYVFYSDNHNLFYSFSRDHGQTWAGPFQINRPPSSTAIFPWSAAGDAGKVDVVWYGTSFYDGVTPPDAYPYPTTQWYVYFAQNLSALTSPGAWTQVQASPVVHLGGVCEGGVSCLGNKMANRDLYDDFGVDVRPTTGLASIIYSDDQYDQYNHTLTYPSSCTQAANNTGNCDHTSIATQTSGAGILGGGSGGGGTGGTCREADGDGTMPSAKTGTATASFDQDSCEDGDTNTVQANDPGAGEDFKSTQIQSAQFDDVARSITVFGTGLSNGRAVNFQMVAVDNGVLPGTFFLSLDDGYTLSGTLLSGSIQLH